MNIGILGGTFDPVHNGHLHIAHKAADIFSLDCVYFVPAQLPPHKQGESISNPFHRFAMLALALCDEHRFLISTLELEPGASSYTVDTLKEFCRRLGLAPHNLFFIAGGDSFQCIPTWRSYEYLLSTYNMLFIERPEFRIHPDALGLPAGVRSRIVDLRHVGANPSVPVKKKQGRQGMTHVYLLELDAPNISSTAIRNRLSLADKEQNLVPEAVADYINKHHLYKK